MAETIDFINRKKMKPKDLSASPPPPEPEKLPA